MVGVEWRVAGGSGGGEWRFAWVGMGHIERVVVAGQDTRNKRPAGCISCFAVEKRSERCAIVGGRVADRARVGELIGRVPRETFAVGPPSGLSSTLISSRHQVINRHRNQSVTFSSHSISTGHCPDHSLPSQQPYDTPTPTRTPLARPRLRSRGSRALCVPTDAQRIQACVPRLVLRVRLLEHYLPS